MAVDDTRKSEVSHIIPIAFHLLSKFVAEAFQRLTPAIHRQQCQSLHGSSHHHFATTYGIHFNSILNESNYFQWYGTRRNA